jgi:hypothetical protein
VDFRTGICDSRQSKYRKDQQMLRDTADWNGKTQYRHL